MRILVTTPYFPPVVGGSQSYILGLYAALRRLDPSISVDVLTYNTERAATEEVIAGLRVLRVPAIELLPRQFAIPNYWQIYRLLTALRREHRYDFVNAHTRFFDTAWWSPLAAQYLDAQPILTDHCAAHPMHEHRLVRFVARTADFLFAQFIVKKYPVITVVSRATQDFLASMGITHSVVIRGGVDTQRFGQSLPLPPSLAFLRAYPRQRVITFAGRFIPAKGVLEFARAAQALSRVHPDCLFVIAGQGDLASQVARFARPHIIVVADLSQAEVAALLQHSAIYVHPSRHSEGLPLTLLEAGAAGCAIVGTGAGEAAHLLSSKRGVICQPTAASIFRQVNALLGQPAKIAYMANAMRRYIQHDYDWSIQARAFHQLLAQQAQSRSPRRPLPQN